MRIRIGIILLLLATAFSAFAQFEKLTSFTVGKPVYSAAVDRPGELYLVFDDNTIARHGTSGAVMASGQLPFKPDVFDPRDGSRLFAFNRKRAEYIFFAPFFSLQNPPVVLDSAFVIDPFLACSSGDRDLLIIDEADWSLKKVNLRANRLLFESMLSDSAASLSKVTFVREYQNLVFMLQPARGIMVFNMLGHHLRTIDAVGARYFNFLGEEVYHLRDRQLLLFDLFNAESRVIDLPYAADFALLTDERLYLIKGQSVDVFLVKP